MDADLTDQIRFQLPVSIGQRYGAPPEGLASPLNITGRVRISAELRMKGTIRSITSPSHLSRETESSADYFSRTFLNQDFVLIIKADGLNRP